jgi:threonine/homoserine/homoserine lactone efflux protein
LLTVLLAVAVTSLSGVMLPGPLFAVTVAKSYRSPWAGAKMSIGHAIIEVPLILLLYFGITQFLESATANLVLSLLGGSMVIWLSVSMFRARTGVVHGGRDLPYGAISAGALMSGLNPFFLLWWATVGLKLITDVRVLGYGGVGLASFIAVHWLCDLLWLSFVSALIYRTHGLWGKRFQEGLFIACGLLLLAFGGWFIVSGIQQAV